MRIRWLGRATSLVFCVFSLVFLAGCCCCCNSQPGTSTTSTPEGQAFHDSNSMITSYDDSKGVGFGNTPEATQVAVEFSELAAEKEPEWFSGGSDSGISLSDGNFLTYCRMNDSSVCFLVHVPQLKNYEGNVRDELINMLWECANTVLTDKVEPGTEVAIGLRGTLLYGGLAIGKLGDAKPSETENAGSVDQDKLHRFFKDGPAAPATDTPDEGEDPAMPEVGAGDDTVMPEVEAGNDDTSDDDTPDEAVTEVEPPADDSPDAEGAEAAPPSDAETDDTASPDDSDPSDADTEEPAEVSDEPATTP